MGQISVAFPYFGDDNAPITIPQAAAIDALDTDIDKGYTPLLETEDGGIISVQPVMQKNK